jgi:uncharacterized membrane protein
LAKLLNMDQLTTFSIAMALAWASGIRLYAVLFLVGLAGHFQWLGWELPSSFQVLSHPIVLVSTGLLLVTEFFADKVPAIDSIWDAVHTFIRIPAGALLAAGVIGAQDSAAWSLAAGILGGSITAGTHFLKAGGRAAINTSPEPFTNWTASFSEDAIVPGGLWLALKHPLVFLGLLLLFLMFAAWAVPKLWRLSKSALTKLFGPMSANAAPPKVG